MGRSEIENLLPHRHHMALLDRIAPGPDDTYLAEININDSSFWASGHFPLEPETQNNKFPIGPIFPGVLMVESAAQLSICFWRMKVGLEETAQKIMLFKQIEKAKFNRDVRPGDRLYIRSRLEKLSIRLMRCHCEGLVIKKGQSEGEPSFSCSIAGMTVDK